MEEKNLPCQNCLKKMISSGMKQIEIAKIFKVSRQAVNFSLKHNPLSVDGHYINKKHCPWIWRGKIDWELKGKLIAKFGTLTNAGYKIGIHPEVLSRIIHGRIYVKPYQTKLILEGINDRKTASCGVASAESGPDGGTVPETGIQESGGAGTLDNAEDERP